MRLLSSFRKPFFQIVNVYIVVLTFLLSNFSLTAWAFESPATPSLAPSKLELSIPADLGILQSAYWSKKKQEPLIVHIQDAHAQPEAQFHIDRLLEEVNAKTDLKAVFYEGVFRHLTPEVLNPKAGASGAESDLKALIQRGILTGGELFAWRHQKDGIQWQGADDLDLYKKSYQLFREIKLQKLFLNEIFKEANRRISMMEVKLNPGLMRLVHAKRLFSQEGNPENYLTTLRDLALEKTQRRLEDSLFQFDRPNLSRFLKAGQWQKEVNFQKALSEIRQLKEALKLQGETPEILNLQKGLTFFEAAEGSFGGWSQKENLPFVSARAWMEALSRVFAKDFLFLLGFPSFLKLAGILILQEEISAEDLLEEAKLEEALLMKSWELTQEETEILKLDQWVNLVSKLLRLELGSEEFSEYLELKKERSKFNAVSFPLEWIQKAEEFYRLSLARDRVLFEKTGSWIEKNKRTSNAGEGKKIPAVVLISGGFHTQGLETAFRKNEMSYLVVRPALGALDQNNLYEKVMGVEIDAARTSLQTPQARFLVPALVAQSRSDLRASGVPPLLDLGNSTVGQDAVAFSSRSELRLQVVDTTNLPLAGELAALESFLIELEKENKQPGSGRMRKVVFISDQHGTIDKFDALLLDAIRSVLPSNTLPENFSLNPDKTLAEQLAAQGVSIENLKDEIFFHNLGDLMDRGPFGVKVYRRSDELIRLGFSDFIVGNHCLWMALNLWGIHLPWYEGYNFYGYSDEYDKSNKYPKVDNLLRDKHRNMEETKTKDWWAFKLYEFTKFQENKQKKIWSQHDVLVGGQIDEKGKRKPGTGLYDQVSPSLNDAQKEIWGKLRGYNPRFKIDIYTGVRAVGTVSLKWWQELLVDFKNAYNEIEKKEGYEKSLPANQAWEQAITLMEKTIIPDVQTELEKQLNEGNWWWRIFEAINYKNYETMEWWAKDWAYHKDWGTAVFDELNIGREEDKKINQANYLEDPVLQEIAAFYRRNFFLWKRDIYQNTGMHAFLPVDLKTGEFYFNYKGVEYRGKGGAENPSVWDGLSSLTRDIRDEGSNPGELYEAFSLVNSWYADFTTQAKAPDLAASITKFGVDRFAAVNGFNRLFTGHIPFHEFSKLPQDKRGIINRFLTGARIGFTDHGMGDRFGSRGGYVRVSPGGISLSGYENKASKNITPNPGTLTEDGALLFTNPGLSRDKFLPVLMGDVKARIDEIETKLRFSARSEVRQKRETAAKINIKVFDRDGQIAAEVGERIIATVRSKPNAIIGIPTGSSPLKVYAYLIKRYQDDKTIDFSQVRFYNLDEYDGSLEKDHPLSYLFYSQKVFYEKLDAIDPNRAPQKNNRNVPSIYYFREQLSVERLDISAEAKSGADEFLKKYKKNHKDVPWKSADELHELFQAAILYRQKLGKEISENGSEIDFLLLGVGGAYPLDEGGLAGGHIGFNEPGSKATDVVRVIDLTPKTIKDTGFRFSNVRYREDGKGFSHKVPLLAITMGIADFLKAKEIAVIATGEEKSIVMQNAWERDPDPLFPVTYLKKHPNVKWYLDKDAASKLPHAIAPWTINPRDFNWTKPNIRKAAFNILKAHPKWKVSDLNEKAFKDAGVPSSILSRFGGIKTIKKDLKRYLEKNIFGKDNDGLLPRNEKIVLFSPHPDDDVITSAALLELLAARGNEVHVVYLVAGENGVRDTDAEEIMGHLKKDGFYGNHSDEELLKEAKTQVRENEAQAAVKLLSPKIQTHFLRLPYYYHRGFVDQDAISEENDVDPVYQLLNNINPRFIFFSAEQDPHGAHGLGTKVIQKAIKKLLSGKEKNIKFVGYMGAYEEWPMQDNGPLLVVPYGKKTWKVKKKAIRKHKSQLNPLFPSFDRREFWQRARDRNGEMGRLLYQLGYVGRNAKAEVFKYLTYEEFVGRSEIRLNSLPEQLAELEFFLNDQGRNYGSARWVAVHIAGGFFLPLPENLARKVKKEVLRDDLQNISPLPFVIAKGGDGASLKQVMGKSRESALDIEIVSELPSGEDLEAYLFGIANLLRQEEGRYFQLIVTEASDKADKAQVFIENQYPDLKGRLLITAVKPQQSLQNAIQQRVNAVYERAKTEGRTSSKTASDFYQHVVISSADEQLLRQSLIPQGRLVHNDLPRGKQGIAVARAQREFLLAEEIEQLNDSRVRMMSALKDLLSGEDLSLISRAFDEMLKGRSFSQSA